MVSSCPLPGDEWVPGSSASARKRAAQWLLKKVLINRAFVGLAGSCRKPAQCQEKEKRMWDTEREKVKCRAAALCHQQSCVILTVSHSIHSDDYHVEAQRSWLPLQGKLWWCTPPVTGCTTVWETLTRPWPWQTPFVLSPFWMYQKHYLFPGTNRCLISTIFFLRNSLGNLFFFADLFFFSEFFWLRTQVEWYFCWQTFK